MQIRKASLNDFNELYSIGKSIEEFKVSSISEFMEVEEFKNAIKNIYGIFLLAEDENKIIGFIYADTNDIDNKSNNCACLIYLCVLPEFREKGIAKELYKKCENRLKTMDVKSLYAWANTKGGIINFLEKQNFSKGHNNYIWMDKKL